MSQSAAVATKQFATSISLASLPPLGTFVPEFGGIASAIMRGRNRASDYLVIVPDVKPELQPKLAFGPRRQRVDGADDDHDGLANTIALCASPIDHPAARYARAFTVDGIDDFYLPARNEIRAAHINVPELFGTAGAHWTSTQYRGNSDLAWGQSADYGLQNILYEDCEFSVVAVRRLLIIG